jgi:DNA-binding NarL/FixJ family response regulator
MTGARVPPTTAPPSPARVLVIEDHPLVRAGLGELLREAAGVELVGSSPPGLGLWPLLRRCRPALVVVGCGSGSQQGLIFCRRVRRADPAPRVLAVSPDPGPGFVVAAILAGAHGVADASGPPDELLGAARRVAAGERALPALSPRDLRAAGQAVDPDDLPILGMALNGTTYGEIAGVAGLERGQLERRLERMIARLGVGSAPWASFSRETRSRSSSSSRSTGRWR